TGLRGVGKTVLLKRFETMARANNYHVVHIEATDSDTFLNLLFAEIRAILFTVDPKSRVKGVLLGILKSFSLTYNLAEHSVNIGVEPTIGAADSGILHFDLTSLFLALGNELKEQQSGLLLSIDELQYLKREELEALIMTIHRTTQDVLPILLVGAGLPQLPALAGEAKSYAERLFSYPRIGPLSRQDITRAVREPALEQNVDFTDEALEQIYNITRGYPYFLQEWAYQSWNLAPQNRITLQDINAAESDVLKNLDENFFRVRYDRLTHAEKRYLRAMAELGEGPHRSGDVAALLGVKVESLGPVRNAVMKKGMIYSPQHGDTAFTVPLFDTFMKRMQPFELARAQTSKITRKQEKS
ncbi:MAG: AAA family ATPase, partial [Vulcanimicrobiaceae bacterium]